MYVTGAPTEEDFTEEGTNPSILLRVSPSVVYVEKTEPYELIASLTSPFGAGFDCYTQNM